MTHSCLHCLGFKFYLLSPRECAQSRSSSAPSSDKTPWGNGNEPTCSFDHIDCALAALDTTRNQTSWHQRSQLCDVVPVIQSLRTNDTRVI